MPPRRMKMGARIKQEPFGALKLLKMDTIYFDKVIAKRKQRKGCDFCGGEIQIGETYYKHVFAEEGTIWTLKSHLNCYHLAVKLDWIDQDGLSQNGFHDYVDDTFYPDRSEVKFCLTIPKIWVKEYRVPFSEKLTYLITKYL